MLHTEATTICQRADLDRATWYDRADGLLATGTAIKATEEGTTLYSIPEREGGPRVAAPEKLIDCTAAELRDVIVTTRAPRGAPRRGRLPPRRPPARQVRVLRQGS